MWRAAAAAAAASSATAAAAQSVARAPPTQRPSPQHAHPHAATTPNTVQGAALCVAPPRVAAGPRPLWARAHGRARRGQPDKGARPRRAQALHLLHDRRDGELSVRTGTVRVVSCVLWVAARGAGARGQMSAASLSSDTPPHTHTHQQHPQPSSNRDRGVRPGAQPGAPPHQRVRPHRRVDGQHGHRRHQGVRVWVCEEGEEGRERDLGRLRRAGRRAPPRPPPRTPEPYSHLSTLHPAHPTPHPPTHTQTPPTQPSSCSACWALTMSSASP